LSLAAAIPARVYCDGSGSNDNDGMKAAQGYSVVGRGGGGAETVPSSSDHGRGGGTGTEIPDTNAKDKKGKTVRGIFIPDVGAGREASSSDFLPMETGGGHVPAPVDPNEGQNRGATPAQQPPADAEPRPFVGEAAPAQGSAGGWRDAGPVSLPPLPRLPRSRNVVQGASGFQPPFVPSSSEQDVLNPGQAVPAAEQAALDLRQAVPDKDAGEAFLRSAQMKLTMGDVGGAIDDAERSARAYPNPRAHLLKADALSRAAEQKGLPANERRTLYLASRDAAQNAVRLSPGSGAALTSLAWAQLNLGDRSWALRSASLAVRFNPRSARARAVRAYVHDALGRNAETIADISEAARLDPARFSGELRAAQEGRRLFDARSDDSWQLLDLVSGRRGGGPARAAGVVLLLLLAAAAGFGAWFLLWRPRRSGAGAARSEEDPGGLLGGKYRLCRVIGKGGMGEVWESKDESLGRAVALKKMAVAGEFSSEARELCLREARTSAALHHPKIVDIYEILDLPSGLYLVFELLSGKTVQQLLAEQKRLSPADVRSILLPVCEALSFAHGLGVVHRDVKPSNIMVSETGIVKVMDFGIARRLEQLPAPPQPLSWTQDPERESRRASLGVGHTRTMSGTPAYMAPECVSGVISPASDVFSLGVCFHEMLTGELPFGRKGAGQMISSSYNPASAAGIPAAARTILSRSLEFSLEKRMQSVQEFSSLLSSLS
jgi:tetratricopeptide (TPR) repeat protein